MFRKCLLFVFLLFSATLFSHAQQENISIDKSNVTVKVLLTEIGKTTNYSFMYNNADINENQKISFKVESQPVDEVLEMLAKQLSVTYQINGRQVILKKSTSNTLITITGKIIDVVNNEPIIGATIQQTNSVTNGTVSDIDGNFSLKLPSNSSFTVSYMGYLTKTVQVKGKARFTVYLEENSELLDEVVVVGYGTQKKVNLTGAVESLDLAKAKGRAYTNASAMLQGNITGAFISQISGQPGNDNAKIQIRGIGTFNNTDPLIIIDGMEGSLDAVNPKDIESVSVLKDAASSAIYGNRAANGVVLITTKSGELDKMNIEYNGLYGLQKATSLPNVLKGIDYLELKAEAYRNTNNAWPTWYTDEYMDNYRNHVDEYMYPTNYSWLDDTYRTAQMTDHYIAISGGSKNLKYSTSAGYLYQDGIVKGNSSNKFTFRGNVTAFFFDQKLQVNATIATQNKKIEDLVDGTSSAIYGSYVAPPTIRMTVPGIGYNNAGYSFGARDAGGFNRTRETPLTINASVSADLIKGLNITVYGGMDRTFWENKNFKPTVQLFGLNDNGSVSTPQPRNSELSLNSSESQTYVLNGRINYNLTLAEKHVFAIMGGYEMREYTYHSHWMSRKNLTVNIPEFGVGDPDTQENSSSANDLAWMSYFGRLNYTFNERYMFEFNLRYDGSSRFIDKWGLFPSASAAWRITEERFMKQFDWLNNLKLRLSWGRLGNESIGQSYAASDELSLNGLMNFNNTLVGIAAVTKLANKKTSWETTEQYNIGLDVDVFNKISTSLDYYIKNTSDILMQVPVSSTLGMTTVPYQNAGKMRNRGLEMTLRYNDRFGDVGTQFSVSATRIKNEVRDLAGKDELIMGNTIWRVGESFNSFYGLQTEGIYQSQEEINNHLVFNDRGTAVNPYMGMTPMPGDIRFKDQINVDTDGDGIPDSRNGIINADDKVILGPSFPKWTFSATLGLDWKEFDLSIFLQGVSGIKTLNQGIITVPFHSGDANVGDWYMDRWTPENPSQTIQRLYSDPNRSEIISEYYLENASYIRCKSLDIGYTLPRHLFRNVFSSNSSVRFYVSMQNLFTITSMRYGFDPEKPTSTTNTLQYPQSRIYSLGVNLKF